MVLLKPMLDILVEIHYFLLNSIGDHLETLEVYYDSSKIAFENLLTIFEKNHNYIVRPNLLQYYSAIFYNNENEKRALFRLEEK